MTPPRPAGSAGIGRGVCLAILGLAFVLRAPTACFEYFHQNDEVWQYLEQSYRVAFGRGIVPWEYRAGIRSWLVPLLLAPWLMLGKTLAGGSLLYLAPVRLFLAACSLSIVLTGMMLGARISRLHGIVAGLALAVSGELIYFSARALSDTIAVALVLPAILLLADRKRSAAAGTAAGLLLGLAFSVRFQLAPCLALIALWGCRADKRAWAWLIAGGAIALGMDALADLTQGAPPFRWAIANFHANLIENRSASYGVEPASWFVTNQIRLWSWGSLAMLPLIALGTRRLPALLVFALVIIAVHSLIPHKEYRFILLGVVLLIVLAAIGLGDAIVAARARWPQRRAAIAMGAALVWLGCTAFAATSAAGRVQWQFGQRTVRLLRAAHDAPEACGLAFLRPRAALAAAYLYYDRATPIYVLETTAEAEATRGAYDLLVGVPEEVRSLAPGWERRRCFATRRTVSDGRPPPPESCLYVRPGPCTGRADPRLLMNNVVIRHRE